VDGSAIVTNGTTSAQTLTFAYNPANGTYTVTRPDGVRQFGPSALVVTEGGARVNYREYQVSVTNGFENLLVGVFPDTSDLNLNYVSNGLLVRQLQNGSTFTVTADSFLFGIPTQAGGMPTGTATYDVYLLGATTEPGDSPKLFRTSLFQAGQLEANFGTGTVNVDGMTTVFNSNGGGPTGGNYAYSGSANISSTGFSGTFTLAGVAGTWQGSFFGPAAEEVGAAFRSNNGTFDYSGTMVGASDPAFRYLSDGFLDLNGPSSFSSVAVSSSSDVDSVTGDILSQSISVGSALDCCTVSYDPTSNNLWRFSNDHPFDDTQIDSGASDDQFTAYANDLDPNIEHTARLLKPGPGNSLVELTYTSFAIVERTSGYSDSSTSQMFVFGFETDLIQVPTTGSASYTGVAQGFASSNGADSIFYLVDGTSSISVDFAAATWNGALSLTGNDRNSTGSRNFGDFTIEGGLVSGGNLHQAEVFSGLTDVGIANGYFFGPFAEEVGGTFMIAMPDTDHAGHTLDIRGLFMGKQD